MMKWIVLMFVTSSAMAVAQARFSDARYGVSFTYPRDYALKRGLLGPHDTGLGYLGPIPMEFVAPGGVRVATVEAPAGAYPGTDFVNAFFTVSVNQFMTSDECAQFPNVQDKSPTFLVKTKGGLVLHGVEQSDGGMDHQFVGAYYHTFSHGECVELGYGIASAGYGAVEGMRQAPYRLIESRLRSILLGVTVFRPKPMRSVHK